MEAMAVDHYIDVVHSIHVILLLFCIHMYIYHIALYVYPDTYHVLTCIYGHLYYGLVHVFLYILMTIILVCIV